MLNFIGTGSAFNTELGNNSAFLKLNEDLLLIDCGGMVFHRLQELKLLDNIKNMYIIITHTHPDHVGSLGDTILYNYYIKNIKVNLIFPQEGLLKELLQSIGVKEYMYNFSQGGKFSDLFKVSFIRVTHVDTIPCYGFIITLMGKNIYYSGDSNNISSEVLNSFLAGDIDTIYQDTCGDNNVTNHLNIDKLTAMIPSQERNRVYCIHQDKALKAEKVKALGFNMTYPVGNLEV